MLEQINEVFFEEANELLESLEGMLLSLEETPTDKEIISAIFRVMHTIKGSSGMFGFDAISKFTHEVEGAFDMVRNGIVPVTPQLINLTLASRDHILKMLKGDDSEATKEQSRLIIDAFKELTAPYRGDTAPKAEPKTAVQPQSSESQQSGGLPAEKQTTWRISFTPSQKILCNGTRPSLIIKEIEDMGTATMVLFCQNVPLLSEYDPQLCYLSWDIILTTSHSKNDIEDAFIFLDEESSVKIERIDLSSAENRKIGEILIERKAISKQDLDEILNQQKKLGELLVEKKLISKENLQSALAEQTHIKAVSGAEKSSADKAVEQAVGTGAQQSIRVNSEKLDQLIDLVGELVTFNARLGQLSQKTNNAMLLTLSEQSERLILSLRDTAMDMRMLPIGTIFTRFRRLVHDLASDLHKNIELVTEGAETELDKTVIEKLNDPLIHMIRNSVDHGIETPEKRAAAGKNPQGTVKLVAQHAGAFVLITISDDGAGLDKERIYKKAVERGLVSAGIELPDNEIYEMIFLPGFSTSENVTSVSGRGVGMDVVKKDITSLGGTVSIETTPGKGSNFILKIPLTLAIIEGMMVQIGNADYVIPLTNVEECLEFNPVHEKDGSVCSHIEARGQFLPYINLRTYFEITDPLPASQQVVVVNDQDSKLGIVVDRVIGNHQTVIKPLGMLYKNIQGLSGATILGDGSVALILDIFKLSDVIRKTEAAV